MRADAYGAVLQRSLGEDGALDFVTEVHTASETVAKAEFTVRAGFAAVDDDGGVVGAAISDFEAERRILRVG